MEGGEGGESIDRHCSDYKWVSNDRPSRIVEKFG